MVQRFSESAGRLNGVQLFHAGRHRGKKYTVRHLDEMVDSFRRYSTDHAANGKAQTPLLEVPGVLGHEDDQKLLDDTSLPAAAWLKKVWRKGKVLYGNFADVPAKVARLIKGKRYKHVSAEIYDEHPDGLPTAGQKKHMLRRIAFLGGEIPQIKTLDDIPVPDEMGEDGASYERFSEERGPATRLVLRRVSKRTKAGTVWLFSEVRTMDREAILKKLSDLGMDTTVLGDAVSTEALTEMLRVASGEKGGEGEEGDTRADHDDDEESTEVSDEIDADEDGDGDAEANSDDGDDDMDTDGDGDTDDHGDLEIRHEDDDDADDDDTADDDDDEAEEHGEEATPPEMPTPPADTDDHEAMAEYYEKCAEHHRAMCGRSDHSEDEKSEASRTKPGKGQGTGNNNQPVAPAVKPGAAMLSEKQVKNIIKRLEQRVEKTEQRSAKVEKFTERQLRAAKEKLVRDTVDNLVAAGKVLPGEVDDGLVDVLLSLPTAKTLKFSEKGKTVERSPLDQALLVLKKRPNLMKFGERIPGKGGKVEGSDDAEIEKVKEHYQQFSEQFDRAGMTEERLIQGFKANRKTNAKLTAAEFLHTR
jgi:hypothetical protein